MASFTLAQVGYTGSESPSVSCQNAVWQAVNPGVDDAQAYPFQEKFTLGSTPICLACWCMLTHSYVVSPRYFCDGNTPTEEPSLDKFIARKP